MAKRTDPDNQYGKMLDQYMADIKNNEIQQREITKMRAIERTFSYSPFDFMFPWHMHLGKYLDKSGDAIAEETGKTITMSNSDVSELEQAQSEYFLAYTPFKLFNRRRTFLVWLHSDKFSYLFNEEEKERITKSEDTMFKSSLAMKGLSVLFGMQLRFYKRPLGRSWLFDLGLAYMSIYCLLASNVPGVIMTWNNYSELT